MFHVLESWALALWNYFEKLYLIRPKEPAEWYHEEFRQFLPHQQNRGTKRRQLVVFFYEKMRTTSECDNIVCLPVARIVIIKQLVKFRIASHYAEYSMF